MSGSGVHRMSPQGWTLLGDLDEAIQEWHCVLPHEAVAGDSHERHGEDPDHERGKIDPCDPRGLLDPRTLPDASSMRLVERVHEGPVAVASVVPNCDAKGVRPIGNPDS